MRDFSCHPVSKRVYPGIIQSEGKEVDGLLLQGLNKRDVKILDYFEDEGVDYSRQQVSVEVEVMGIDFKSTSIVSQAFVWNCGGDTLDLGARWDYDEFVRQHLARYLERVVKALPGRSRRTVQITLPFSFKMLASTVQVLDFLSSQPCQSC